MSNHDPLYALNEDMVKLRSIQEAIEDKKLSKTMGEILSNMEQELRQWRQMSFPKRAYHAIFYKTPPEETLQQTIRIMHDDEQTPKQHIQVLNAVQTETTHKFCSFLKEVDGVDLIILSKVDAVDDHTPLVILCPNSSRLKPDVDLALEGIQIPSMSVVIIIHTVSERNLPSLTSAEKLSSYSEYNNITFIDMGYEQDRGIYKCNQNRQAFQQLHAFVEEFYKPTK